MSKKVLIISTSLRGNSNSEALAHEFAKGAKDAGHPALRKAYEMGKVFYLYLVNGSKKTDTMSK